MKEDSEKWLEVILVGNIVAKFYLNLKLVILQVLALALMLSDEHKLLKKRPETENYSILEVHNDIS